MPEFRLRHGSLIVNALEPLVLVRESSQNSIITYSPEELSLVVEQGFLKAALRMKSSEAEFSLFDCNHNGSSKCNLEMVFQQFMNNMSPQSALTIFVDDEANYIHIEFEGDMEEVHHIQIPVTPIYNTNTLWLYANVIELQYEYTVVVGIPSENFRRAIARLSAFGKDVIMIIEHKQVRFEAVEARSLLDLLVLSRENGECIIGGVKEGNRFYVMFDLHHLASLWTASYLSNCVWIFQTETSMGMLNFPVRALGNIMYHFH